MIDDFVIRAPGGLRGKRRRYFLAKGDHDQISCMERSVTDTYRYCRTTEVVPCYY